MVIYVNNANTYSEKFNESCVLKIEHIRYIYTEKDLFEVSFCDTENWSDMAQKLNNIDIDYNIKFNKNIAILRIKTNSVETIITGDCF